jgi:signal transduction histidine kinase/ligand-binding sensor domain-containing protein
LVSCAFGQFHFDNWTVENGLPQNAVRAIHQSPDGYLWLVTMDGLARFDGIRFTVFNKANSSGIETNRFTSLYQSPDGDLWLGTESGGVTRYHQGRFTSYTMRDGLPHEGARVTGDETGRVWAGSGGAIAEWQPATHRFSDVTPVQPKNAYYLPFVWEGQGGFWAANQGNLYWFVKGRLITYSLPAALRGAQVTDVAEDQNGKLWVGCSNAIYGAIDTGRRTELVYKGRDGRPWPIGISAGRELQRYVNLPPPASPARLYFASSAEDREGNLWLGIAGKGLYRVRRQLIGTYSKQDGLIDRNVYPIYQDRAGAIWIGAWRGGLSRLQGGKFTSYTPTDGLPSGLLTAISEDKDGRLWIGAYGGVRIFQGGSFRKPSGPIVPADTMIAVIHTARDGAQWFGTEKGLVRYKDGNSTRFTVKDGLAGDDVRVVLDGKAGALWIGGYGGLTRFADGKFTAWTQHSGLPGNSVRALYEDADGVLWIGTYDSGLIRFDKGKFTHYSPRDGLFSNGVFRIFEDARGNFWMSCNAGIYRVRKQELNEFARGARRAITSIAYGKTDGMLNVECNGGVSPAGIQAQDGKLWFPTQDGVAVIDPAAVSTNTQPPPVTIESFLLDQVAAPLDRPLRIDPGHETFEIQYTALSFINPERIRFQYKLEGYDADWKDVGSRRTAYYSHVRPGDYVFRVIAANSDGVWNTEGKSLRITVLPAYYQTWWFRALAVLSAAGLVWLGIQYRLSGLRRAQAAQQAFSRDLISSQENERKRIAAELHDSLGQRLVVIKNLALMLLNQPEDGRAASVQIEEISNEASQALAEVKEISRNLRPYQLDRIGLTKAVEAVVKSAAAASKIEFAVEIESVDDLIPKPLQINFYRIVQESVSNIVKHSRASRASVTAGWDGERIALAIWDNGQGFTAGASNPDASRGGFGLIGISERAQLLGGTAMIQSAPGQGTTIRIEIVPEGMH